MKIKGRKIKGFEDLKALLKVEVPDISEGDLEGYSNSLQALLSCGEGIFFGHYPGTRESIEHYVEGVKEVYQKRKTQSPDEQPSVLGMPEIYHNPFPF